MEERTEPRQVGGTDIAAIVGRNPYVSRLGAYRRILGLEPETPDSAAMEWGRRLEPVVAQAYAERTGRTLVKGHRIVDADRPWAAGSPDYLVCWPEGADGIPLGVLEVKTAGRADGWGPDGSSICPEHYRLQAVWYAALTGYDQVVDLAVLIAGRDFRVIRLDYDPHEAEWLLEEAERFWRQHVLPRIPPEPTDAERVEAMERLSELEQMEDEPELEGLARAYAELTRSLRETERARDEIAEQLKLAVGDRLGVRAGRYVVKWSPGRAYYKLDTERLISELGIPAEAIESCRTEMTTARILTVKDVRS